MNNKRTKINEKLLKYQTMRLQKQIQEILKCCTDRKLCESQKFGLPYAELNFLMQFNGERYLTVKNISQKLEIAKSRVTKIVGGLIEKGMVEKINDPVDTRVKLISLTPAGKRKAEKIEIFLEEIHRKILLQMGDDERRNVLSQLELLRTAMEAVKGEFI